MDSAGLWQNAGCGIRQVPALSRWLPRKASARQLLPNEHKQNNNRVGSAKLTRSLLERGESLLLLLRFGRGFLDVFFRIGAELVAATGAAHPVVFALIRHPDRPQSAADDALRPLRHVRERNTRLRRADLILPGERDRRSGGPRLEAIQMPVVVQQVEDHALLFARRTVCARQRQHLVVFVREDADERGGGLINV